MTTWAGPFTPTYLLLEHPRPGVALIRLNRPDARNALSMAVRREIARAAHLAAAADGIRVIVIAGSERCFASGGDIKENATLSTVAAISRAREKKALWGVVSGSPKPVIAAVRGYALGGGAELMMLADVIIAARDARIGQPEAHVGIVPGSGGTQRLPRAVGKYAAMKILLTGGWMSGAEAARAGLVSEAVEDVQVETRVLDVAVAMAGNAPLAAELAKEAILAADDAPLETGLALEHKSLLALLSSADFKEGAAAFLAKRQPIFTGR